MSEERRAVVVGIEGTHGAGKTAAAHALVARLREGGLCPTLVTDAGRSSPFVQDRLSGQDSGVAPLLQELTLIAARIRSEVEAFRDHGVVVCDKTVLGALAYLRLFDRPDDADPLRVAVKSLCAEYAARTYDLVVLLDRRFDSSRDPVPDRGRYAHSDDQQRYQELVREELTSSGIGLLQIASMDDAWVTSGLIVAELHRRDLV